jgi:organic radical activating enzyme
MKDFDAIVPAKDKWISIAWQVNDFCNFRCSYCSEWNWAGRNKNEDNIDQIQETLEYIIDYYQSQGYRYFKLFLSGGEPTYWKGLIPIVETFRNKVEFPGSCVGVNTNFSRPLKWWEQNHYLFDDVVASYHPEWCKEEKYIENYKFLQDKKNYLCARLMMHDKLFEQCIDFSKKLKKHCKNYMIEYAPVYDELRPTTDPWDYSEEWKNQFFKNNSTESKQKMKIKKDPNYAWAKILDTKGKTHAIDTNEIITEGKNFFKGWYCNIHESLHIFPDGKIQQASCGVGTVIGNILEGKFETKKMHGIWCPKAHCHCAADINISKAKKSHVKEIR